MIEKQLDRIILLLSEAIHGLDESFIFADIEKGKSIEEEHKKGNGDAEAIGEGLVASN